MKDQYLTQAILRERIKGTCKYPDQDVLYRNEILDNYPFIKGFVAKTEGEITQAYRASVSPELLTTPLFESWNGHSEHAFLITDEGKIIAGRFEIMVFRRRLRNWFRKLPEFKVKHVEGVVYAPNTIAQKLEELCMEAVHVKYILTYCQMTKAVIVYEYPEDSQGPKEYVPQPAFPEERDH